MRALLEKDIRILLLRKSTMVMFLVIGIVFTWSFSAYFSGAYLTMLGSMLAISTISYDEADNCMPFLFTLPCARKQYVLEKYLFVYGFSFIAGLIGLLIILVASIAKGLPVDVTIIIETLASEIPILLITGGIMIPLQLKFGPEKSRMVLLAIVGVIFVIGYMISKSTYVRNLMAEAGRYMDGNAPIRLFAVFLVLLVVLSVLSVSISGKIMDGKEY
ncbi:MAG: ABC-2 transporter permease [Lachnospiraceae bacterium]|nr:ABC-2 transporter permease [Lachnospiraceae bacterium]